MDVPATVTSKGQITLPKAVRVELGLESGDRVYFRVHKGKAVLAKVPDFLSLAGSVPVPPGKRGLSGDEVSRAAWGRRSSKRR
jgi:AbrB family looped-hinge helix DNA binding protein